MGNRFGRNRNNPQNDPFYNAVPPGVVPPRPVAPVVPAEPYATLVDPTGGLGGYDPYEEYGYGYQPASSTSIGNIYGRRNRPISNNLAGRYAQGFNQAPGEAPWNYGNYYLGNTTMQMMPFMLSKFQQFGMMQAMSPFCGAGFLGSMPIAPAIMPCPYGMSMSAPMMAAATPLPVAVSPLVQGMYPMASMSPVSWMAPASFMSALTSGPMPYRPPGFDFPNNVGMVMTIPYGTPNPLLLPSNFGNSNSFGSSNNMSSYSYCWSVPVATAPALSMPNYYPSVANSVANCSPLLFSQPAPASAPLLPSHGFVNQAMLGQPPVMRSNPPSATNIAPPMPIYDATNQSSSTITAAPVTSSFSAVTPSIAKTVTPLSQSHEDFSSRIRRHLPSLSSFTRSSYSVARSIPPSEPALPPIICGELISDSGWLPKIPEISVPMPHTSRKKHTRPLYTSDHGRSILHSNGVRVKFVPNRGGRHQPRLRRRHHRNRSNSSASEYDCAICQEQRDQRRIRNYLGTSSIASLLSSNKASRRKQHLHSNESFLSSLSRGSSSRHHQKKNDNREQSNVSTKQNTPVLLRRSPIQESSQHETIEKQSDRQSNNQSRQTQEQSIDDHDTKSEVSENSRSDLGSHTEEE